MGAGGGEGTLEKSLALDSQVRPQEPRVPTDPSSQALGGWNAGVGVGSSIYCGERKPRSFWVNLLQSHPAPRSPSLPSHEEHVLIPTHTHTGLGLWAVWSIALELGERNTVPLPPSESRSICFSAGVLSQSSILCPVAQASSLEYLPLRPLFLPHPSFGSAMSMAPPPGGPWLGPPGSVSQLLCSASCPGLLAASLALPCFSGCAQQPEDLGRE